MIRLYFDTETTGLVQHERPLSDPAQPYLVELGALLVDDARGHELVVLDTLIYPAGYDFMPPEAQAIHGITYQDCLRYGMDLHQALAFFTLMVLSAEEIVVANQPFEMGMAKLSAARASRTGTLHLLTHLNARRWRDTTRMGREAFPDLPLASHGLGPRQKEIHHRIHGTYPEERHRALPDATTLRANFLALDVILSGGNCAANAVPAAPGQAVTPDPLAGAGAESPATSLLGHAQQTGDVGLPPMQHQCEPVVHPFIRPGDL